MILLKQNFQDDLVLDFPPATRANTGRPLKSGCSEANSKLLRSTMTATLWATVSVSLLLLCSAAPAEDECSQLTRALTANQLQQILGRWIFIEGTCQDDFFGPILDGIESMWMVLNRTADNQTLLLDQSSRVAPHQHQSERCLRTSMNVTLVDSKDLELYIPPGRSYHRFLTTCPDCLLMFSYNKENSFQMLYLFGRTTTMAPADLNTFRKQAACLQFPLPSRFQYDTSKELCPE